MSTVLVTWRGQSGKTLPFFTLHLSSFFPLSLSLLLSLSLCDFSRIFYFPHIFPLSLFPFPLYGLLLSSYFPLGSSLLLSYLSYSSRVFYCPLFCCDFLVFSSSSFLFIVIFISFLRFLFPSYLWLSPFLPFSSFPSTNLLFPFPCLCSSFSLLLLCVLFSSSPSLPLFFLTLFRYLFITLSFTSSNTTFHKSTSVILRVQMDLSGYGKLGGCLEAVDG